MLKAWGIPESCWSSVYFGVLKALVLILEKECHRNSTDVLARDNENKVVRSKVFFSVLLSGLPPESIAQIWDAFLCFK